MGFKNVAIEQIYNHDNCDKKGDPIPAPVDLKTLSVSNILMKIYDNNLWFKHVCIVILNVIDPIIFIRKS